MTREILFRGKSKLTGMFLEGNLVIGRNGETSIVWFNTEQKECWTSVCPDTIGQYTGLKDKNGKKIFEGDILVCGREWTTLVLWNEELATFALQFIFENKVGKTPLGEWQPMEVISNIYDNPELLKGGK
uniref:YopX protein domain-containing protein n=1 Tax=Prevotella sp. GTC17254 TaxID=3236794 RepID=A0AB33J1S7_9BACT